MYTATTEVSKSLFLLHIVLGLENLNPDVEEIDTFHFQLSVSDARERKFKFTNNLKKLIIHGFRLSIALK